MNYLDQIAQAANKSLPRAIVKISNGDKIKIRATTVGELQLLSMGNESDEWSQCREVILQILGQCIENYDQEKIIMLPVYDIEKLYINLYMLSQSSSKVNVGYKCQGKTEEGKTCNYTNDVVIDLNNVVYDPVPNEDDTIVDTGVVGIKFKMRYPTMVEYDHLQQNIISEHKNPQSVILSTTIRCISEIHFGEQIHHINVFSDDENKDDFSKIVEIVNTMPTEVFDKLSDYVFNIPTVRMKMPVKCEACSTQSAIERVGFSDFFD